MKPIRSTAAIANKLENLAKKLARVNACCVLAVGLMLPSGGLAFANEAADAPDNPAVSQQSTDKTTDAPDNPAVVQERTDNTDIISGNPAANQKLAVKAADTASIPDTAQETSDDPTNLGVNDDKMSVLSPTGPLIDDIVNPVITVSVSADDDPVSLADSKPATAPTIIVSDETPAKKEICPIPERNISVKIYTYEDLAAFRDAFAHSTKPKYKNKIAVLAADIDCCGVTWDKGLGWFDQHITGYYYDDGTNELKKHEIKNLNIGHGQDNVGFVSMMSNATVEGIRFSNITVNGGDNVGLIAGLLDGSATIHGCEFEGCTVNGKNNVGGLVGNGQDSFFGSTLTIENIHLGTANSRICINAQSNAGSLAGYVNNDDDTSDGDAYIQVNRCIVFSNIEADACYGSCVGSIEKAVMGAKCLIARATHANHEITYLFSDGATTVDI